MAVGPVGQADANPDEDGDPALPTVRAFRAALVAADAVVIACPEYAHGVPGASWVLLWPRAGRDEFWRLCVF